MAEFSELTNDEINVARQALSRIITKDNLTQLKSGKENGVRAVLSDYIKDETVIEVLLKKLKKIEWGNEK